MSGSRQARTSRLSCRMTVLLPRTDMQGPPRHDRFVPMPDMQVQTLTSHQRARCDGAYERPADAFLSGSISDCAEKGFVRNAMHPEWSAAVRTAGSSFPVM